MYTYEQRGDSATHIFFTTVNACVKADKNKHAHLQTLGPVSGLLWVLQRGRGPGPSSRATYVTLIQQGLEEAKDSTDSTKGAWAQDPDQVSLAG